MGTKEWLNNLANNLKKERKKLNISQQKLAELSKLSIATVKRVEQSSAQNLTLETIEVLGHALKKADPLDLLKK
ncbi:MAG: helix-turn-helix transcriptional regulator [Halobacteriovoraceae bacterium]|nr:helix-turn-helix transcriptional regulator [Halobacteriovoraceae bacterium]